MFSEYSGFLHQWNLNWSWSFHRVDMTPAVTDVLKDESGKNTINLTELEQSLSCPLTPRLTQSV